MDMNGILSPAEPKLAQSRRPWWRIVGPWQLATLLQTRRRVALALIIGMLIYSGLVALMLYFAAQTERSRIQTEIDGDARDVAQDLRSRMISIAPALQRMEQKLQVGPLQDDLTPIVSNVFDEFPEVVRIELRSPGRAGLMASANRRGADLGSRATRIQLEESTFLVCEAASLKSEPQFSTSSFIPFATVGGFESIDLCVPIVRNKNEHEFWVATISLGELLRGSQEAATGRFNMVFLSDPDGSRLATLSKGPRTTKDLASNALIVLPGNVLTVGIFSRQAPTFGLFNTFSVLAGAFSILFFFSILLLARDILRRQRAERALSQTLAFRKAMEDSVLTGLRARDLEGSITYVNPAFCDMVGFSQEELIGKSPPVPYWPPEAHNEYEQRFARRAADSMPRDVFETEYLHSNGKRVTVLIYEAPLIDAKGEQTGWMASVLDVSEQRRIENVARAQQDKLAEASRLTTVGELASTLSHELNQPLAAIASFAAAGRNLLEQDHSSKNSDIQEILRDISAQADRAGRVIKSVRGFVRRGETERVPVDMHALLEEVTPLFQLQARAARARVNVEIKSQLPMVLGDRTLLEQVLLNLSRNGFEAMHDTPATHRCLEVIADVEPDTDNLLITVADAGTGIEPKIAEQLFSPFFTTKREGMGLGLSICRNVIEQHGGSITAEHHRNSPSGTGTVFRITLPPHDRLSRR